MLARRSLTVGNMLVMLAANGSPILALNVIGRQKIIEHRYSCATGYSVIKVGPVCFTLRAAGALLPPS